jgi:capsid protein
LKDIQASVTAIENGLASRSDVLAEAGMDYEAVLDNLAREKQMADAAGLILGASANMQAVADLQQAGASAGSQDETTQTQ